MKNTAFGQVLRTLERNALLTDEVSRPARGGNRRKRTFYDISSNHHDRPGSRQPWQMYRATYSPDDNKLRLYAAYVLTRKRIKKCMMPVSAGHPTGAVCGTGLDTGPGRRAPLTAGEIEDEDSTLAERQEARAGGLPDTAESGPVNPHRHLMKGKTGRDDPARSAHSCGASQRRRARRDAQRIENGMKRAVMPLNVRNTGRSGRGRHSFTRS